MAYYKTIWDRTKAVNGTVLLNHGTQMPECFAEVADIMLSAETDWWQYSSMSTFSFLLFLLLSFHDSSVSFSGQQLGVQLSP